MKDGRIGLTIVTALLPERVEQAVDLLNTYFGRVERPGSPTIVRAVDLLRSASTQAALSVVDRFKGNPQPPEFYVAWAKAVLSLRDTRSALRLFDDTNFDIGSLRTTDPVTLFRISKLAGIDMDLSAAELVERAASSKDPSMLISVGEIFDDEGRLDEFEIVLHESRRRLPIEPEEILSHIRRRGRGPRYMGRGLR
jgi:hypothetical protein